MRRSLVGVLECMLGRGWINGVEECEIVDGGGAVKGAGL